MDVTSAGSKRISFPLKEWKTHFEVMVGFIDDVLKTDSVMVHCMHGCKGAGAVSMGYMMTKKGFTFEQAYEALAAVRPCVEELKKPANKWLLDEVLSMEPKAEL